MCGDNDGTFPDSFQKDFTGLLGDGKCGGGNVGSSGGGVEGRVCGKSG
eukprot:CAMPEP_0115842046 /NCGR_PEP_ID=MMETSP0287-20121206/7599_1 /TAXON_ID=412157 /ORGANISM="Chrysochromulina rotalis, Strain UIO044" /LENGTH=47 /DNA_ID= /DNA_START= /DNA_END= /DNA_ORIENTATION=